MFRAEISDTVTHALTGTLTNFDGGILRLLLSVCQADVNWLTTYGS